MMSLGTECVARGERVKYGRHRITTLTVMRTGEESEHDIVKIERYFSFWEIIILLPTVILHVSGPFPLVAGIPHYLILE